MDNNVDIDIMLLGAVLLWGLNVSVTKYVLTKGWDPLAYGTVRSLSGVVLFGTCTYWRERSFRIARSDLALLVTAGFFIGLNQICFVYGVKLTHAPTAALLLGTTPVFVGLLAVVTRTERLTRAFWFGSATALAGVALIATSSGPVGSNGLGTFVALAAALTWACYTVCVVPLMRRYSPIRISALVLAVGSIPMIAFGAPAIIAQPFSFGWLPWLGLGYAIVGPLFLTNIVWYTAIAKIGPIRAALFANLQTFFAVAFAVVLLSDRLYPTEIAGGVLIVAGISIERLRRHRIPQPLRIRVNRARQFGSLRFATLSVRASKATNRRAQDL